jgi:hypothetical protein
LLSNVSVMPRNLNKEDEILDNLKPDEFVVSQMQSLNLYKESIFSEEMRLLKLIRRSKTVHIESQE